MRKPRFILPLILLGFLLNNASAQSERQQIELSALTFSGVQLPALYLQNETGEYQRLSIGQNSRGTSISLPAQSQITLYTDGTDAEGQPTKVPGLSIPLSTRQEKQLLIFYRDDRLALSYKVIDDTPNAHEGGTARMINLMDVPVACRIGNQTLRVEPGEDLSNIQIENPQERFPFAYALLRHDGATRGSPVAALRMRDPNQRFLAIFTQFERVEYNMEEEEIRSTNAQVVRLFDVLPLDPET